MYRVVRVLQPEGRSVGFVMFVVGAPHATALGRGYILLLSLRSLLCTQILML